MPQTVQWSVSLGNTTRVQTDGSPKQGQGKSTRLYVGRYGGYDHRSFLNFTPIWTNVGQIVSAYLTLYTDDGGGDMPSSTTKSPIIQVRRLTGGWSEGTNSSSWTTSDYVNPASTSTHGTGNRAMDRAEFAVNNIDVTAMVEDIAPKTVKKRDGTPGGNNGVYGFMLLGDVSVNHNWAGFSEDYTDAQYRPILTVTFEYGPTAPDALTNVTPTGGVAAIGSFQGDFTDIDSRDMLAYSEVEVYDAGVAATGTGSTNRINKTAHGLNNLDQIWVTADTGGPGLPSFTLLYVRNKTANDFQVSTTPTGSVVDFNDYSAITYSKRLYAVKLEATSVERTNARIDHVPVNLHLPTNTNFRWRGRAYDSDGSTGTWAALTTFSVTNTDPNDPVLSPVSGGTYATLDGVNFSANAFTDPDTGDYLLAYQVQLSAYPEGDNHWLDDQYILWNTGKKYVASGATTFSVPYGGAALTAGTYYWRARWWDNHHGVSNFVYATLTVSDSFEPDPDNVQTTLQLRPKAPWRIVIKDMGANRGPGNVVAILEDAKNVGASEVYNSPGEIHFTLGKNHPQLSVIEPKQTHYSVQFRQGDGWREVFAGLMWDFDATDTDIVFYGKDYLALLDYIVDERYDASQPDKPAEKGGSKYVTAGKNSISYIINDQLTLAKTAFGHGNSPVGFITVGSIASMTETLEVFSTYSQVLTFLTSLMDSHRQGTGKRSRLYCRQKTGGGYEWTTVDDPGVDRDNLRLRYGELVQGYRVVAFGENWASGIAAIGRAKDGVAVQYKSANAPGINEATWGRFVQATFIDGISDGNDLQRRVKQIAAQSGKLGKQIALGIRSNVLQPKDGWNLLDSFPIDIEDGSVSTSAFGSGYWDAVGVTWEVDAKTGKQTTSITFQPREDATSPDSDLLTLQPISPQAEWQIGWTSPDPLVVSSKYWLDQTTGKVYVRVAGALLLEGATGTI